MRIASHLLAGCILAACISCPTLAATASPPPNYQGLWWNAPPESESGWGINLAHQGDVIFATWFTYGAAGRGWWLALTANRTGEGTYSGELIETTGPAFHATPFDPAKVTRTAVGTGTLSFRDGDDGTFTYAVKGVSRSKSITRQVFGPLPTCVFGTRPDFAAATNYQDLWWVADGAESGWGINLTHQGDVIFATWFTYDRDGTPLWLAATATKVGQAVYSGSLIRTTGPAFDATPFDPARVTRTVAGTVTLTFANGNAATLAYTLDGVSQSKAITRELFFPPAGTVCGTPEAATIKGRVFDGPIEKALVCADVNGNGHCDAGEAQAVSGAAGEFELAPPAGFGGPLVAEIVAGQARDADQPGTTVDRTYRMASPSRAYSPNITPFTTLVYLAREGDLRLAEEIVRNHLGLPPGFDIRLAAPAASGSLSRAVATSIVAALKETAATLDFSSPGAFAAVVEAFPPALTELPRLRIATKGGAPIDSREVYVDATFSLANPAAALPPASLNGKIRGRGNSTWWAAKKPYKVQFANDAAYAGIADILGMKKNRNWALLADHQDRSLIRNKLAFSLANSSVFADGLKWAPSGQHLEVYVNDDYVGVYLLTEDIRIDPARLDIRKMSSSPAANDLDGGYIVEVDVLLDCYNDGVVNLQHRTPRGVPVCIKRPDEGDGITPGQQAYIKNLVDTAENEIYSSANPATLNLASFADWYLLNELFRNQDAVFYSSDFMWKDTAAAANPMDRLLNMGPIWDFDISAGNITYNGNWLAQGCWVSRSQAYGPNWLARLLDDPGFLDLTLARWKVKRAALERFVNSGIETFTRRLEQAQQGNFARWPVLGTRDWNNYYVFSTYAEEVAFLRRFLNERMAWLDEAFASPEAFAALCK